MYEKEFLLMMSNYQEVGKRRERLRKRAEQYVFRPVHNPMTP